jgi:zinc-ribbon domain
VRYCPNCGTEVDDTAAFCPTCGQAIDQAAETAMPAAPAWPEPAAPPRPHEPAAAPARSWESVPDSGPTGARPQAPPPPPGADASAGPSVNMPVTMPVTLSGWLIGGGALLAGIGVLIELLDGPLSVIQLILLIALIGIAVATFFPGVAAGFEYLRLASLAVALVGFGVALDRLGTGGAGVGELLLFLGTAGAAIGAILLEMGRDQPLGSTR